MNNNKLKLYVKRDWIFFYCYAVVLWILFAFNYKNNDYSNYENLYIIVGHGIKDIRIEKGFTIFMNLVQSVNFDFQQFHILISLIYIVSIVLFLNKYAQERLYVLILFSIFPYILDTIQIRNAMAGCIMLYGYSILLEIEKNGITKKNIIKYIVIVFFAAQFHSLAYAYLLFLMVLIDEKILEIIIGFGLFLEIVLLFFKNRIVQIIGAIFPKINTYVLGGLWNTKYITQIMFLIMVIAIPILYKKVIFNDENKISVLTYKITLSCALFYILFSIDVDFFRLYRNCFLYIYIAISNCLNNKKNNNIYIYYGIFTLVVIGMEYAFIVYDSENINNIMRFNTIWNK